MGPADDLAAPVTGASALQSRLAGLASAHRLPGLAVVLVSDEGHRWCSHQGHLEGQRGAVLGAESLLRWYSLTKPVSASMVMCLVQQGVLKLSTQAREALPEWAPFLGESTVEDLLCHRAGFADWQIDAALWFRDPGTAWPDPREALGAVLGRRRRHRARPVRQGAAARYSNLGYAVLGEVAAQAAGRPYRQLLSELVLTPLGMDGTGFGIDRAPGAGNEPRDLSASGSPASGHVRRFSSMGLALRLFGGRFLGERVGPWRRTQPREIVFSPHGGLVGPARDLAPFLALHLGGLSARAGAVLESRELLLSNTSLRELRRARGRRAQRRGEAMGLGWVLSRASCAGRSVDVCRHGGRGPGFSTEMMVAPELGLALGVLLNVDADAQALCRALLSHGRQRLLELAELDP